MRALRDVPAALATAVSLVAAAPDVVMASKPAAAAVAALHAGSAEDVIHDYVTRTRGWFRNEYRIEPQGRKGDVDQYWVVHVDDERAPVPGGRKSFAVDYDPRRREVTKEWRFQ